MVVVGIWTGRHATALLKALRLTNESFAAELGTAVRTVAKWNANPTLEPTPEIQLALDTFLAKAPEDAKARFALILEGTGVPTTSAESSLIDSDDIAELVTDITRSCLSAEAIDAIGRATVALAETHTRAPAQIVLAQVLKLHSQAREFLRKPIRLSQRRELFKIESELLAHACLLLGDLKQDDRAHTYGAAALTCAREAGANEAIARTALAKTLRWQDRLIESADMAREGFIRSSVSPVKIQLASQEANAAALLGDKLRAREALKRAEETAAAAPPDSGTSAWSFPTARQALFTLSVATQTGDPDTALRAASLADAAWTSGEPRVPATWAQIRIGAGIAHLVKDQLEGTIDQVVPVLTLPPELRMATVTAYIDALDKRLDGPRFHSSKISTELRRSLREFNAEALPTD
jgi:hypothetical protein